jgi:hypothetical protein
VIDIALFGGKDNIDILESKMWLDLEYIQEKILRDTPSNKDKFTELFNFMVKNVEIFKISDNNNSFSIRSEIDSKFTTINNSTLYKILDPLRKWYVDFCYGGIMQAYKGIDAEFWYPKIIFKEKIESDILELPEKITLYRGTSIDEYDSKSYGQSWSLSKKVAKEFAYKYYSDEWKRKSLKLDRIVLKMIVNRKHVLFYEKDSLPNEEEVIIDSKSYNNEAEVIDRKSIG